MHASLDWKLAYLSVRENEISDLAYDNIIQVVNKLQCLKRLYLAGNLFFRESRLKDIVSMCRRNPDRIIVPEIIVDNIYSWKLTDDFK